MKQLFILFFISVTALYSCNKNTTTNYPVDADLKAAFNFMPGTYWIYQDSLSGMVDSFLRN